MQAAALLPIAYDMRTMQEIPCPIRSSPSRTPDSELGGEAELRSVTGRGK